MKIIFRKGFLPVWLTFILAAVLFCFDEIPARGEDILSTGSPRKAIEDALFIISAPGPLLRSRLARCGEVIEFSSKSALVRTTQSLAERLAGEGMEIARVMPASRRAPTTTPTHPRDTITADDSVVASIIERIDSSDISRLLGNLSGENSVWSGGENFFIRTRNSYQATEITRATQYCYEYLSGLGLSVSYNNYTWGSYNWRNVVAEQLGTVYPDQVYIICAHLDDMPVGSIAPGADDNGSGSVAVLHGASILRDYLFEKTIRYLLFTGEEQGLIGSHYYVQDCVAAGDNILGVLNLDMIGYDSNSDGAMEIYCGTTAASSVVGDIFIDTINRFGLLLECTKYTTAPSWSDQYRFWEAGYPAIVGIESFQDFNPDYHTTNDISSNCNLPYLTNFVKAAVGTLACLAVPTTYPSRIEFGDYNGDGTADPAIFRPDVGLWAIRGITRVYFGGNEDIPISGDYSGDGTADLGIYRSDSGLWAIRGITRLYFGSSSGQPIPGDYNGDGLCDIAIFRKNSGLWAIRGMSRLYFGMDGDDPVPGDYDGDGTQEAALFRPVGGLWSIRDISHIYYGTYGDQPVPGNCGTSNIAVFRPSSGLWAFRGLTRLFFGTSSDQPVPADYNGNGINEIGVFRDSVGLWAVKDVTRMYFGSTGDIPVTR